MQVNELLLLKTECRVELAFGAILCILCNEKSNVQSKKMMPENMPKLLYMISQFFGPSPPSFFTMKSSHSSQTSVYSFHQFGKTFVSNTTMIFLSKLQKPNFLKWHGIDKPIRFPKCGSRENCDRKKFQRRDNIGPTDRWQENNLYYREDNNLY